MARRLMGMTSTRFDSASRFRFTQFIPFYEEAGWEVVHRANRPHRLWHSRLPLRPLRATHNRLGTLAMSWNRGADVREAAGYDVVFVSKDLGPGRERLRAALLRRNPRVVYDFDDAIYLGRGAENVRWMCEHAAWVTPGNEQLAAYARQFTDRLTVVPTVVDTGRYVPGPFREREMVRVGWSGSDTSVPDTLLPHLPMIARIQRQVPFEFVVSAGRRPPITEPDLRWSFLPWTEESEVAGFQSLDIGLMPLEDTEFQRAKCGLKLLLYMAAGIPAVASPVGVNAEIVEHGRTGFLATTEQEWVDAVITLVRDPELRRQMGEAARRRCEERYSVRRWGPVLLDLFERVATGSACTEGARGADAEYSRARV